MSNKFSELKAKYSAGSIQKSDFILKAHQKFHSILFDLAEELANTDIASIELTDNKVCMLTKLDGLRIVVDNADQRTAPIEILNFNAYEPELAAVIRSLAPFMNTMLDIGANIGWYSLLVQKINPSAVIHAFEPIPVTFQRLKDNIDLNNTSNVYLHNYGLSSQTGTFPFYYYPEGTGNASLQNLANRDDSQVFECALKTLSNIQNELVINETIDFIKCDVEGNELFVIQGGGLLIDKHKPIILLELLRKWSAQFNYHPNDVIELLRDHGYKAYVCTPDDKLRPTQLITEETIETNFFFVHPESRLVEKLTFY